MCAYIFAEVFAYSVFECGVIYLCFFGFVASSVINPKSIHESTISHNDADKVTELLQPRRYSEQSPLNKSLTD